ncbi:hypothetical protein [Marimonas arenosa]|uniref:Sulfotransferase domain-containing protein n=1 Tax=Marimonas arenosa TaxID=1795305 RepID=A0AAE3WA69_9RHOB|nr:hypothetical protein [Marimonas arenosa]MDQ2088785.1 hypothetical protein [Marimonas arenosa]
MAQTIVHIGHGKTGSSAIQSFLALNAELLRAFGIEYPWHDSFAAAREGRITSGNYDSFYRLEQRPAGMVLFSSEKFCRDVVNRPEFLERLAGIGGQVKIICYTRDLFDHFLSAYGQLIKRGRGTDSPRAYAERHKIFRVLARVIDRLEEAGIALELTNYSRLDGPIEMDFAHRILGAEAARLLDQAQRVDGAVNRSLTRAELALQRLFNEYAAFPTARFISDALCNALPEIRGERPPLDSETCNLLIERNRDAIARINRRLPAGEAIRLEPPADAGSAGGSYVFSEDQLRVLARSVSEEIAKSRKAGRQT